MDNPADDPTRDKAVRAPSSMPMPGWLKEGLAGHYASLDSELESWSLHLPAAELIEEPPGSPSELSVSLNGDHRYQSKPEVETPPSSIPVAPEPPFLELHRSGLETPDSEDPHEAPPAPERTCSESVKPLLSVLPRSRLLIHPRFRCNFDLAFNVAGFLDLYSGKRGIAKKLLALGAPWVLCYDIDHDPSEDLLRPPACRKRSCS